MKITIKQHNGGTRSLRQPYEGADYLIASNGDPTCYRCGTVFKLRVPRYRTEHDRYIGAGRCVSCDADLGTVTVRVDTIFGIEEDRRVLDGRCRVY